MSWAAVMPHEYDCPVRFGSIHCSCPGGRDLRPDEVALWSAFAARVELRFPFRVDVLVSECDHGRHSCAPDCNRARMSVRLHVLDRDTREPITVDSGRPCPSWTDDKAAADMLFDLLEVALRHETYESVRLDGRLVNEMHKAVPA